MPEGSGLAEPAGRDRDGARGTRQETAGRALEPDATGLAVAARADDDEIGILALDQLGETAGGGGGNRRALLQMDPGGTADRASVNMEAISSGTIASGRCTCAPACQRSPVTTQASVTSPSAGSRNRRASTSASVACGVPSNATITCLKLIVRLLGSRAPRRGPVPRRGSASPPRRSRIGDKRRVPADVVGNQPDHEPNERHGALLWVVSGMAARARGLPTSRAARRAGRIAPGSAGATARCRASTATIIGLVMPESVGLNARAPTGCSRMPSWRATERAVVEADDGRAGAAAFEVPGNRGRPCPSQPSAYRREPPASSLRTYRDFHGANRARDVRLPFVHRSPGPGRRARRQRVDPRCGRGATRAVSFTAAAATGAVVALVWIAGDRRRHLRRATSGSTGSPVTTSRRWFRWLPASRSCCSASSSCGGSVGSTSRRRAVTPVALCWRSGWLLAAYLVVLPVALGDRRQPQGAAPVEQTDLGTPHQRLELTTADGLRLQAWYALSHNRAAVSSPGRRGPVRMRGCWPATATAG